MVVEAGTKVIVIGAAGSGKTSLVTRLVGSTFSPEYQTSFGADLTVKTSNLENKQRTLNIWVCAGHARYKALMEQFYVDSRAVLICFDMTSLSSFKQAKEIWLPEIRGAVPDAFILLVGTKASS
ncbi:hypothetical protein SmJEL517_g00228 [Synchytrium microbalum]|uniref:Uncharacterized protein n=1 Tax=Synchytrium microbalum TaxID=1806994 RepID=A0A507CF02_9FUNG|nr:uncharacterized protein SmJEL517_g00228 [Synchytrium microbalum]TPX38202.1 hypothetical protein SmJEL517_g00228 [Synchytrium microbalum]